MKKHLSVLSIALLSGAITLGAYKIFFEKPVHITQFEKPETPSFFTNNSVNTTPDGVPNFTVAAEQTVNAVVHVTSSAPGRQYYDPFAEFFFGQGEGRRQMPPSIATGSGVIISEDGYIVTNNHVINGAQEIEITMNDNQVYNAEIVGTDPTTDIALLKIDEDDLPYAAFANSDDVRVGEWVLAVGNPFNLNSTVTAGIVSAKGRNINLINDQFAIESFIQTDAAVNPGNSGGALVNTLGELIGINTAISTRTGSFEGYSFAVPSNIVRKVVEDLREYGIVQRAFIGVQIRDLDAALAAENDLDIQQGVYISGTTENGAAEEAGIRKGDVILEVDGVPVTGAAKLQEIIGRHRPGDIVDVLVHRSGREKIFEITLRNKEGKADLIDRTKTFAENVLGVRLEKLSDEDREKYGIENGVKIAELFPGKFSREGIRQGFVITEMTIDSRKITVNSPEDILENLSDLKDMGVFIKGYYPGGKVRYYALGM